MLLNTPIDVSENAAELESVEVAPKTERSARPTSETATERPARSKTARRARVLEPDQVAASRGEDFTPPPQSTARDEMLGAEDTPETSKVGAILQSFGQIASRFKKSKTDEAELPEVIEMAPVSADAEEVDKPKSSSGVLNSFKNMLPKSKKVAAEEIDIVEAIGEKVAVEDGEMVQEVKASSGVLGSLRNLVSRSKKDADEEHDVVEDVIVEETLPMIIETPAEMSFDDIAFEDNVELPEAYMLPKPTFVARFDTPMMGVLAAVCVSLIGLVGASVLIG
jgi:hypothetical protein